jgi:hypothetical protein
MADIPVVEPREAVLGAGAGGPLTAPGPWIQEKDATSAYIFYSYGVMIGNPSGGNKGVGALNLQTLYINGNQFLPVNYLPLAGGTMIGVLTLSADPVGNFDAATKRYVDLSIINVNGTFANYLPLIGGTLTGMLTLLTDPTANLQAATKQYVDSKLGTIIQIPDAPSDGTNYGRKNGAWANTALIDVGTY